MHEDLRTPFADLVSACQEIAFESGAAALRHIFEKGDFAAADRYEDLRHGLTKALLAYERATQREERGV